MLLKTGAELTAAVEDLEARRAQIASLIASTESKLADLADKYKGRSGRRNGIDTAKTNTLKDALLDLNNGELPTEAIERRRRERRDQKAAATNAASAESHAKHHSSLTDVRSPDQRRAAGAAAAGGGVGGGVSSDDPPPDDAEDNLLPEGVDKYCNRVSDVQNAFHDSVLAVRKRRAPAAAAAGERRLGGGGWSCGG